MAYSQNLEFTNVGSTVTLFTAPAAGQYTIQGKIQLPRIAAGSSQSALIVLLKKNGSTVYTGTAGADGFSHTLNLAAGDAMTMATSSANSVDSVANNVKYQVSAWSGV